MKINKDYWSKKKKFSLILNRCQAKIKEMNKFNPVRLTALNNQKRANKKTHRQIKLRPKTSIYKVFQLINNKVMIHNTFKK